MGWSCSLLAGQRLDLIQNLCHNLTKQTNVWIEKNNKYMFEIGRENRDGSITGTIHKFLPDNVHVRKSSTFKINPDGSIQRGPKFFKQKAFLVLEFLNSGAKFPVKVQNIIPTDQELEQMRIDTNKSYEPGGINSFANRQSIPFVKKYVVIDLDQELDYNLLTLENPDMSNDFFMGKKIVKTYNAPMFEVV